MPCIPYCFCSREDDAFLEDVFGMKPTPKYDKYADAFAMLEQGKV